MEFEHQCGLCLYWSKIVPNSWISQILWLKKRKNVCLLSASWPSMCRNRQERGALAYATWHQKKTLMTKVWSLQLYVWYLMKRTSNNSLIHLTSYKSSSYHVHLKTDWLVFKINLKNVDISKRLKWNFKTLNF